MYSVQGQVVCIAITSCDCARVCYILLYIVLGSGGTRRSASLARPLSARTQLCFAATKKVDACSRAITCAVPDLEPREESWKRICGAFHCGLSPGKAGRLTWKYNPLFRLEKHFVSHRNANTYIYRREQTIEVTLRRSTGLFPCLLSIFWSSYVTQQSAPLSYCAPIVIEVTQTA